jgi:hypothetical protein
MTVAMLEAPVDSLMTTDSTQRGCEARDLADLTTELTSALNGAIWSYMLRAELEDALDTALFRAVMAETPTLSGAGLFSAS